MATPNPHIAKAIEGIGVDITFAGTNKQKVNQLYQMVISETRNSDEPRNLLDGMLPSTRDHLAAILVALEASITNV